MEITTSQLDHSITLIRLDGSLNTDTLKPLRPKVSELLEAGHRLYVVDCTALKFVSSAGIGAMVMLHRDVSEQGATLRFAGAQGAVLEVMELMNLGSVLNLSPDVEQAVASLVSDDSSAPPA